MLSTLSRVRTATATTMMEGCSDFGAEVAAALNSAANDLVRSPRPLGGFRSGIKGSKGTGGRHSITPAENGHSKKWREESRADLHPSSLSLVSSARSGARAFASGRSFNPGERN